MLIETERLVLREWRELDAVPLLATGRDPEVMQFLGPLMSEVDAKRVVAGQIHNQSLFGHCFWPIERREDGLFLGYCGVQPGPKDTPIAGGIEIGWRLARDAWGHGYAREAAAACLDWGFANLDVDTIWAITVPGNARSWRLMERLGMARRSELDFEHPALAHDDPLRSHITYSISRDAWGNH